MAQILIQRRVTLTQIAPNQLEITEGGGWVAVFGAVFLLPGLLLMAFGFHLLPVAGEDFMVNGLPVLGLFGLPFTLAGGTLVFKRRWITLDRGRRQVVIQRGLLVPMFRQELSLQEFDAVTIRHCVETSDSPESYPVILSARDGKHDLSINDLKTYGAAYAQATQLASFLGMPLIDATTDHPLALAPEALDCPLQARLQAETPTAAQIVPPATLRSQVQQTPQGVQLTIPGQVTGRLAYLLMSICSILPLIIVPIFFRRFFQAEQMPPAFQYFILGAFLLSCLIPICTILGLYLKARGRQTQVAVDSQGITIEELSGRDRRKLSLPIVEIMDIDYGLSGKLWESKGISIKTHQGIFTVGAGLPDGEVEYLVHLTRHTLYEAGKGTPPVATQASGTLPTPSAGNGPS